LHVKVGMKRALAVGLTFICVISTMTFISGRADAVTDYPRYEYDPYVVTPTTHTEASWSDTNGIGQTTTTGWGSLNNWYNGNNIFGDWGGLYYGANQIDAHIWSEYYTIFNMTQQYKVGRLTTPSLGAEYSKVFTRYSDATVLIQEKYRENAATGFLSAGDFNVTIRYTIHKVWPIVKLDYFWVNRNVTPNIHHMAVELCLPEDFGTADTSNINRSKGLTTYIAGDNGVTFGLVGWGAEHIAPQASFNTFTLSSWRNNWDSYIHGSCFVLAGPNLTYVQELAEDLGDCWNEDCDVTDLDLVIARDSVTGNFSAFKYFNTTTTIYPSGVNCTVWTNGDEIALTQGQTPIENYHRDPVILTWDDHYESADYDGRYDTIFAMTRRYELRITIAMNPNQYVTPYPDSRIEMYYEKSQQYYGTLFEVGSHGYNHTKFNGYWTAYNQTTLCMDRWANISGEPAMRSVVLPNNYWWDGYLEGLADAGIVSVRRGVFYGSNDSCMLDADDPVLAYSFHILTMGFSSGKYANLTNYADRWGYYCIQGHADDIGYESENHYLETFGSWVQNNSDLISVTQTQFYDLQHGSLQFRVENELPVIDLSQCYDGHPVYLNKSALGGRFYTFIDEETGDVAPSKTIGDTMIIYTEPGHIYITQYNAQIYQLITLTVNMLAMGLMIGVMMAVIKPLKEPKNRNPEKMVKIFVNATVCIVVGIILITMVNNMFLGG